MQGIRHLFLSNISFTRIERLSSQNARKGPSYADLQALRVDGLGTGGTPPSPDTCSFLLSHPVPGGASTQ